MITELIQAAIALLRQSHYAVALTGAGHSTRSGIPDFRSPTSGLWKNANPIEVASIFGFRHDPTHFFEWIRPLARTLLEAEPNAAHYALARIETAGVIKSVITQNIDMLHSRAGSHTVHELHGHLREATCIHCFAVYPCAEHFTPFLEDGIIPTCPECGNVLKPNVILFGEQLPAQPLSAARQEAARCDVMLVAGSSLEVFPAAALPAQAKRSGAKLIFINLSPTAVDNMADIVIQADVVDVLPHIADALERE